MRYRTLGRTGLKVGEIGMGGVGAMGKYGPVTPEGFAATMARASELGMNFLDTAPAYGDSEVVFGHYLRDHRDDWIVCTKIGTCGSWGDGHALDPGVIAEQCEQSLERLCIEYLDVLLIHSIDQYGPGAQAMENVRESGMIDAMERLRRDGKVRFIGVSGQLPELVPAVEAGEFDVALTYNSFNLLVREARDRLLPAAREHDVGVVLGGAFYQGLLSGEAERVIPQKQRWYETKDPGLHQTGDMLARVSVLLEAVGGDWRALRRAALRFAISDPRVSTVVSGMTGIDEVQENSEAAAAGPLSRAERERFDEVLASAPGEAPRWL